MFKQRNFHRLGLFVGGGTVPVILHEALFLTGCFSLSGKSERHQQVSVGKLSSFLFTRKKS